MPSAPRRPAAAALRCRRACPRAIDSVRWPARARDTPPPRPPTRQRWTTDPRCRNWRCPRARARRRGRRPLETTFQNHNVLLQSAHAPVTRLPGRLVPDACGVPGPLHRRPAGRPLVILVAFDGWRWDYLDTMDAPALAAWPQRRTGRRAHPALSELDVSESLHARHRPSAGAARHRLEHDATIRPSPGASRCRTRRSPVIPRWWSGEPIWNTATRQGLKSARCSGRVRTWRSAGTAPRTGASSRTRCPSAARDQVLEWLHLPEAERPSLL